MDKSWQEGSRGDRDRIGTPRDGFAGWLRQSGRRLIAVLIVIFSRHQPTSRRLKYALGGALGLTAFIAVLILLYAVLLVPFTPGIGTLRKSKVEQPSVVLSADGEEITRFRRFNREWVGLDDISSHVVDALIATEDHRFYKHPGFDPIRMVGAFAATVTGDRQGGSTVTQQLARNMFPDEIGRSISLTRKLKELITAIKFEIAFTKDEILEAYLNTVPFYFGAYGIEMAARTYFGTSAADLDVIQSATLVGMLKGTYYYNPVRNPERAQQRRNVALRQMVKRGYLSEEEFEEMEERPIRLSFERQEQEPSKAPHFTEHLRMWLADWADRRGYNIYRDSLVIHTTMDLGLQEIAARAVKRQGDALQAVADVEWSRPGVSLVSTHPSTYARYRSSDGAFEHFWSQELELVESFVRRTGEYRRAVAEERDEQEVLDSLMATPAFMDSLRREKTRLEIGFVAIDPATGYVKAWIGSRDFEADQYDHVARARRQPGSTFKPFVYARALEEGYTPEDRIVDQEVEIPMPGEYVWRPRNAGETVSGREMTLREGLMHSKNTITAQLVEDVGPRDVARLARRAGVNQSELRAVPSIALGTSEVTLLEMVSAYATFASLGVYNEPVLVTRIEDREGNVVAEFEPASRRALSERTARDVVDMMRGVVDEGTGRRIRSTFGISADVAGKTGTTQFGADGWFILMHPRMVAGSWVGFNDPRVRFRSDYWGQGGNNAAFVVGDFFRQSLRGGAIEERDAQFPPRPDVEEKPSFIVRAFHWIRDAVSSVWGSLFGALDDDEPRQRDTYVAQEDGAIQFDSEMDDRAVADSLTRMERRSNRLDSLIQQLNDRNGSADASATDESASDSEDRTSGETAPDGNADEAPEEDEEGAPADEEGASTDQPTPPDA